MYELVSSAASPAPTTQPCPNQPWAGADFPGVCFHTYIVVCAVEPPDRLIRACQEQANAQHLLPGNKEAAIRGGVRRCLFQPDRNVQIDHVMSCRGGAIYIYTAVSKRGITFACREIATSRYIDTAALLPGPSQTQNVGGKQQNCGIAHSILCRLSSKNWYRFILPRRLVYTNALPHLRRQCTSKGAGK